MERDLGAGPTRRWWRELGFLVVAYAVYRQARIALTGSRASALAHAKQVVGVERSLGLFVEGRVHRALLHHPGVLGACNFYYGAVHFVGPAVALLVLFRRHPERYARWRNVFGWLLALGLFSFALYPLLPPRLLPSSFHIGGAIPPLPAVGGVGWSADNPYAAMPSLHIGWATWCAMALWPLARRPLARLGLAAYPFVTLFVVVGTGNHYLLDAFGAWLALAAALGLEELRSRLAANRDGLGRSVVGPRRRGVPGFRGGVARAQRDQGVRGRSWRTPSMMRSTRSLKNETRPAMRGHSTTGSA